MDAVLPGHHDPSPARRALGLRGERGQVLPFVTVLLPVLMLFVALVVNVGQAVNRRVALQFLADTGAFSAATAHAMVLNRMTEMNEFQQNLWSAYTIARTAGRLLCDSVPVIDNVYKAAQHPARGVMQAINYSGPSFVMFEADRVMMYESGSFTDLFPGEDYQEVDRDIQWYSGPLQPASTIGPLLPLEDVPDGRDVSDNAWWNAFDYQRDDWIVCVKAWAGPIPIPGVASSSDLPAWYYDPDNSTPKTWVVKLTETKPAKAMMFPGVFGTLPPMNAVAAAQAFGGDFNDLKPDYIARMVRVSTVAPLPYGPFAFVLDQTGNSDARRIIFH